MALRMLVAAAGLVSSPALLAQEPDGGPEGNAGGIEGKWTGAVVLPTGELPFSVTFERAGGVLSATMDIPAQGASGLPLTAVSYEGRPRALRTRGSHRPRRLGRIP